MAELQFAAETSPGTPPAGAAFLWVDATTKKLVQTDDAGNMFGILSRNNATASQGAGFAADTYVTNSGLLIPSFGIKVGMMAQWFITGSKTAAGVAGAIYTVRLGTNQAVADASILALTAGV